MAPTRLNPRSAAACCSGLLLALANTGCARDARANVPEDSAPTFEQRGAELVIPDRSPLRERLAVAPMNPRPVRHELEVPASAEADPTRVTKISAPLQGRVVNLLVRLGETVRQGAPLFTFDSPDLAAAQSDFLKAKSAEAQALRAVRRQVDLTEHGIGAQKDLEQAQTDRDQAESELARAVARLKLLGMEPGDVGHPLTVRAPISGKVIDVATAPGQYQNDPAAVLMVIADLSSIWVTAQVPEKDLQRVSAGDDVQVQFSAYPGERFAASVRFVGDVLATETRTVKVRIELANERSRFKPGMFARVTLQGKEAPELVVPAAALVVRGDRSFLFVEKAPWTFERRAVEVGEPLPTGISVLRGLSAGERVVVANAILLP